MLTRALFALLLLGAPAARAETIVAHYDGAAYGIIALGRARIETEIAGARYDAHATARTVGLAALFGKAVIIARAQGALDGAPAQYNLDHDYHDERRLSVVDWSGPTVRVTYDEPRPYTGDNPPSEAQKREGRDPLATILAMEARVAATRSCAGAYRVFDGFYVYDLKMRDIGTGRHRRGDIDLPTVRCAMTQTRVAGYASRADLAKKLPEGRIAFALLADAPVAVLAAFSSGLPLGEATISLSRIERR